MSFSYVHWDIDPEISNVFGYSLRYYGVLFAGGILLSLSILKWIFKREQIELRKLDRLTLYGVIGILVGARLGHCLLYDPVFYLAHPLEMLLPIHVTRDGHYEFTGYQGLASHGGAFGLIVALIFYTKTTGESMIKTVDMIAIVAPLAGCFIRLGNLMNSEIIGYPTQVPWAFVFTRIDNLPRHAAQLYEALFYLATFVLLLCLYKFSRARTQPGVLFGLSITMIFIARFLIEFLKEPQVEFEESMILDMGQLLSLPFILVGVVFLIRGLWRKNKLNMGPVDNN
jgi:phosphatidylglycerol---prolipoprotein diacylglyceryl transferase